jgi:hypothetical protein
LNADVNASAAIAGTKISPDFGSQTIATTGIVSHALGTAGAPTVTFTGDTNTGIYSPGADQVAISTAGFGRLHITSGGSVGINTSSVVSIGTSIVPLEIKGAATDRSGALVLSTSDNSQQAWQYFAGNVYYTGTSTNHPVIFLQNATERMRLDSSGRLGVGTSSAGDILHVKGGSTYAGVIADNSAATGGGAFRAYRNGVQKAIFCADSWVAGTSSDDAAIYADAGGGIKFYTNNSSTAKAYLTSGGSLGLGTSSPAEVLHLGGSAAQNIRINGNTNAMYLGTVGDTTQVAVNRRPTDGTIPNSARGTAFINVNGLSTGGSIELATSTAANTGATTAVTIDSSQRVGIGTTSPDVALTVVGTGKFTATQSLLFNGSSGTYTTWQNNGTSVGDIGTGNQALSGGSAGDFAISSRAGSLVLGINSAEKARIDTSGRLLVGTSSSLPNSNNDTLQVAGTGGANLGLSRFVATFAGPEISFYKSRNATVGSHTVVQTDDVLGACYFYGSSGSNYQEAARIAAISDPGTKSTASMPGRLVFSTTADGASSPTERMRIDSLGRFYLGTTNTDPTFNRVNGIYINQNSQLLCRQAGSGGWDLGSGSSTPTHIYFYTDNGSARVTAGNISSNGATTTYNQTSDYRLKENVVALTGASERLSLLRPVNFDWKEGFGGTQPKGEGFIAHELQEVCPLAVQGEKDAVDDKGNPKYQGIDQAKLVPLLTAALQEAIGRIETLEAEVAALKAS